MVLSQLTGQPTPTRNATQLFVANFIEAIAQFVRECPQRAHRLKPRAWGTDVLENFFGVLRDKMRTFSNLEFIFMMRTALMVFLWRSVGARLSGYHHQSKNNNNNNFGYVAFA
jgi:hypothetical protein